jgi:3-oxoacyl-[acyl-carrier protein] reductase
MDLQLKGKNALILGGTRGIGRAIADTLAKEGANVGVCARNADQVAAAVAELKALGVKATGASVDVTDGAALKSWIASAASELGGLDILISNAGAMAQGNDIDAWEKNFQLRLCDAFIPVIASAIAIWAVATLGIDQQAAEKTRKALDARRHASDPVPA